MVKSTEKFVKGLKVLNISLSKEQIDLFLQYYEQLIEKNKVMNLTAITDYEEVVKKHFLDSLSITKIIDLSKITKIIDVGTGAGFPGIPLKIAFPHLEVVLLDSLNKRVKFLNEVCQNLHLENIKAYHGRAEEYGRKREFREQFDLCVSRAVANLSTLSEYCMPFVVMNGYFIPYKAGNVDEEVKQADNAIKKLGGTIENKEEFLLPDSDISRVMLKIKKIKPIAKAYPRKPGIPGKEPLQ